MKTRGGKEGKSNASFLGGVVFECVEDDMTEAGQEVAHFSGPYPIDLSLGNDTMTLMPVTVG